MSYTLSLATSTVTTSTGITSLATAKSAFISSLSICVHPLSPIMTKYVTDRLVLVTTQLQLDAIKSTIRNDVSYFCGMIVPLVDKASCADAKTKITSMVTSDLAGILRNKSAFELMVKTINANCISTTVVAPIVSTTATVTSPTTTTTTTSPYIAAPAPIVAPITTTPTYVAPTTALPTYTDPIVHTPIPAPAPSEPTTTYVAPTITPTPTYVVDPVPAPVAPTATVPTIAQILETEKNTFLDNLKVCVHPLSSIMAEVVSTRLTNATTTLQLDAAKSKITNDVDYFCNTIVPAVDNASCPAAKAKIEAALNTSSNLFLALQYRTSFEEIVKLANTECSTGIIPPGPPVPVTLAPEPTAPKPVYITRTVEVPTSYLPSTRAREIDHQVKLPVEAPIEKPIPKAAVVVPLILLSIGAFLLFR